jgi:hypothetical protein
MGGALACVIWWLYICILFGANFLHYHFPLFTICFALCMVTTGNRLSLSDSLCYVVTIRRPYHLYCEVAVMFLMLGVGFVLSGSLLSKPATRCTQ